LFRHDDQWTVSQWANCHWQQQLLTNANRGQLRPDLAGRRTAEQWQESDQDADVERIQLELEADEQRIDEQQDAK